jgi:hypothetical protein
MRLMHWCVCVCVCVCASCVVCCAWCVCGAGAYLLRPSSKPNCVSLSFKSLSTGKVKHFLCMQANDKWMKEVGGMEFDTLVDLIRGTAELDLVLD